MLTPFVQLNIKRRIFLDVGLVLLISILFTIFNMVSLNQFYEHFKRFKQVSDDTNLILKIDNDLSVLQRKILLFNESGQAAFITQLNDMNQEMSKDIAYLIERDADESQSNLALLQKMQTSVDSFGENFQQLKAQRSLRDDYLNKQLPQTFRQFDAVMLVLSNHLGVQRNERLIRQLWNAQRSFSKAESSSSDYFNGHQFQKRQAVKTHLEQAEKMLTEALLLSNGQVKNSINKAMSLLKKADITFNKALQSDRNYMLLINIVIAGESAELSILSEQLKAKTLTEQGQLFLNTEEGISFNMTAAIYISLLSIVVALVVAFLTGAKISKPIETITETFDQLSTGKDVVNIPGTERSDEIGHLARAANVFNQTNRHTKELLKRSENMTKMLESREKELQERNDDLNNFTHIASHDLKSPIQGIASLAQWIEEDLGPNITEEVKGNLDRVALRVDRMKNLIDDLLRYSQAGKRSDVISLVQPKQMLEEVVDLLMIPQNINVRINCEVTGFYTVKAPLQTTLRNLVTNAIKHHHADGGYIELNVIEEKQYYQFEVKDNGPGILKADQSGIFLLFQTGSKHKESTGMGLAFCKRMIEAHGGYINLESEFGKGTAFQVFWPKKST